jgi:hypothetical protein
VLQSHKGSVERVFWTAWAWTFLRPGMTFY